MGFRKPLVKTEKLNENKEWIVIRYENIKKGDIFRTYVDAEGSKIASDDKGHTTFLATEDAYTENGFQYTVSCKPITVE